MRHPAATLVFEPVGSASALEETVARLGRAVRLGVLPPGTRLPPERELAGQLGISRTTLRQALRQLTESGHVVAQRGRTGGTFVVSHPPISVGRSTAATRELLDRRMAVELGAVALAAERAARADVERLEAIVEVLEQAGDWASFRRADVAFHLAIAEASGSAYLVSEMTLVHGELNELLDRLCEADPASWGNEDHGPVLEAIRRRRPDQAVASLREHLRETEELLSPGRQS